MKNILYVFVEGDDDENFFKQNKIQKRFLKHFNYIQLVQYQKKSSKWLKKYISTINQRNDAEYLYVHDFDNSCKCISSKLDSIMTKHPFLDKKKVLIIVSEIESWLLAGLDDKVCDTLNIKKHTTTDNITKEIFERLLPKTYDSLIVFKLDCLNYFSDKIARIKNRSFHYFSRRSSLKKYI